MKITIIGLGYVGLSLGLILSEKNEIIAYDIDEEKINLLKQNTSPIRDDEIVNYLTNKSLNFIPTKDKKAAFKDSDYYIICTPTNYDIKTGYFDTRSVTSAISQILNVDSHANIVIKSTVPIGFIDKIRKDFNTKKIFFSPEFLREDKSLHDNLFPSRIIVGDDSKEAEKFAKLLAASSKVGDEVRIIKMTSKEAEAVKLFSNTYLAMRISFFNELDSFAESKDLSAQKLIEGISSDPRIGFHYNNPSFGYGGYCLPKDTQQLFSNYENSPKSIIKAVIESNIERKNFIANKIINDNPKVVGIYRLVMKKSSDNFRQSAVLDIIDTLKKKKINLIIYEPLIKEKSFNDIEVINDLDLFASSSNLIIANRISQELKNFMSKVYTRDIFREN